MKIDQIHPETREVIKRLPSLPLHNRIGLFIGRFLIKKFPRRSCLPGVKIEEKTLEHTTVRIYRPESVPSGAGLLWIHGGGFIVGFASMNDYECSAYAKELGLVVVSVEYRLAPKHPFPAAIDDCFEAWNWFQSAASDLGVDPARVAVSGQSAGGGLAASLVQRVYDQGGIQPAAQALIYPMLDDRTAARRELDSINHRIWNNKNNRGGWSWYLGHLPGQLTLPQYAVPARRDNLSGLPPAWIGVGDVDLFYEEDCQYSERLEEVGVSCELYVVPMAPHAFETLVPTAPISQEFISSMCQFLRKSLAL